MTAMIEVLSKETFGIGADPWGDDLLFPRGFRVRVDDDGLPYVLELELAVMGGRPACRAVRFAMRDGDVPVRARGLRAMPLDSIVRAIAASYSYRATRTSSGGSLIAPVNDDRARQAWESLATQVKPASRRTPEHLRKVAEVASAAPGRPIKAVEDAWGVSYSTARRWVKAAEAEGLL